MVSSVVVSPFRRFLPLVALVLLAVLTSPIVCPPKRTRKGTTQTSAVDTAQPENAAQKDPELVAMKNTLEQSIRSKSQLMDKMFELRLNWEGAEDKARRMGRKEQFWHGLYLQELNKRKKVEEQLALTRSQRLVIEKREVDDFREQLNKMGDEFSEQATLEELVGALALDDQSRR
eukprot:GHVS01073571.1.p1 GENE.GHVS01073571.1~~GHVS01073571.1.p1  ORF type:complete len:175 (+),score=29.63 GHVS01073571.1:61-585(+)